MGGPSRFAPGEGLVGKCDPPFPLVPFHGLKLDQATEWTSLELKREAARAGRVSLVTAPAQGTYFATVSGNRAAVIEVLDTVIIQGTSRRSQARPGDFVDCPGEQDVIHLEHHVPVGWLTAPVGKLVVEDDVVGHGNPGHGNAVP